MQGGKKNVMCLACIVSWAVVLGELGRASVGNPARACDLTLRYRVKALGNIFEILLLIEMDGSIIIICDI